MARASMSNPATMAQASAGHVVSGAQPPAITIPSCCGWTPARSNAIRAARLPVTALDSDAASDAARTSWLRVVRM